MSAVSQGDSRTVRRKTTPIAVVTAIKEEFEAVLSRAREARFRGTFVEARIGTADVALCLTGDGAGNAGRAADMLCEAVRPAALLGASRLTIRGEAKVGVRPVTRTATLAADRGVPELDTVLLAVAQPAPFKVVGEHDFRWAPRGTVHHRSPLVEVAHGKHRVRGREVTQLGECGEGVGGGPGLVALALDGRE